MLHLQADREEVSQLCIQPTGGGKTLVFHLLACYMLGIHKTAGQDEGEAWMSKRRANAK